MHQQAVRANMAARKVEAASFRDARNGDRTVRFCSGFAECMGREVPLELHTWPIQIKLAPVNAPCFSRGRAVDCSRLHSLCIRRFSPQISSLRQGSVLSLSKAGYGRLYRE